MPVMSVVYVVFFIVKDEPVFIPMAPIFHKLEPAPVFISRIPFEIEISEFPSERRHTIFDVNA